jgi:hypothetical protein
MTDKQPEKKDAEGADLVVPSAAAEAALIAGDGLDGSPRLGLDPNLAIKYFFKDPDWVLKCAIGGVMNASSLLLLFFVKEYPVLIPIVFSLWAINTGYILRVMRYRIADPQGLLPVWNDWQDLFVSGMSWLAIITGITVFFLFVTATDLLIASVLSAIKSYTQIFALWMSGSIILILTLSLLSNLVLAATMTNFAQEESTIAAFSYIKVIKRILKRPGDFFAAWMLGLGIQWLSFLVPCATIIGIFFLPSTMFAGQLVSASLLAQAWASSAAERFTLARKDEPDKDKIITDRS